MRLFGLRKKKPNRTWSWNHCLASRCVYRWRKRIAIPLKAVGHGVVWLSVDKRLRKVVSLYRNRSILLLIFHGAAIAAYVGPYCWTYQQVGFVQRHLLEACSFEYDLEPGCDVM